MKEKCLVMFSGGLDSRLAVKIMEERGFKPYLVHFSLPFSCSSVGESCGFVVPNFLGYEVHLHKLSKGRRFRDYFQILRKPKYKRGKGVNPCLDCKIFMFREAKKIADKLKINYIVTGEVVGQRPMSQHKNQLKIIEKESGLKGRIIRPLIDYYSISGRQRKEQMKLAKKFKITYPGPGGGCILCEKAFIKRFIFLFERGLKEKELPFVCIGRHFNVNGKWVILGRNEEENKVLEKHGAKVIEYHGPSVLFMDKASKKDMRIVEDLVLSYSKKGNIEKRKIFDKYKL
jgi:hypothetical protein